jgi:hypothetical protein
MVFHNIVSGTETKFESVLLRKDGRGDLIRLRLSTADSELNLDGRRRLESACNECLRETVRTLPSYAVRSLNCLMFSLECLYFRQPKGYGRDRPLMARHKNDWLRLGHVWTWLLEKTIQPVPIYCLMHVIFVSLTSKQQNCDTSVLLSVRQTPGSRAKGCGSSLNKCLVRTEIPRCVASRLHWKLNYKHRTYM